MRDLLSSHFWGFSMFSPSTAPFHFLGAMAYQEKLDFQDKKPKERAEEIVCPNCGIKWSLEVLNWKTDYNDECPACRHKARRRFRYLHLS